MKEKIKYILDLLYSKELGILPAGLAFSFVLALIPMVSLIFYLVTTINVSADFIMGFIERTFPKGVVSLIQPVFIESLSLSSLITLILGLVVTVNGFSTIITASNTIYEIDNGPIFIRLIKSIVLTVILIILITFMVLVPLLGNSIINLISMLGTFVSENEFLVRVIYFILSVPVALLVVFTLVKLIYIIAPDQHIPNRSTTPGSLFTTISWILLTVGFSFYINNVARYDLVYGNLANVVIIMLWFYLLAYIFVIGMIINKKIVNNSIDKTNTIKLEEIRKKIKDNEKESLSKD